MASEVEDHEKAHGQILTEAVKSEISVGSVIGVGDDKGNYTQNVLVGTIDKVLDQASAVYEKVKKESPYLVRGTSKKKYLDGIFTMALAELYQKKVNKDREDEANARVNRERKGKAPYINHTQSMDFDW